MEKSRLNNIYNPSFEVQFWLNEYSNVDSNDIENYIDVFTGIQTMTSNLGFAETEGILIEEDFLTIYDFSAVVEATNPGKRYLIKEDTKKMIEEIEIGVDERMN